MHNKSTNFAPSVPDAIAPPHTVHTSNSVMDFPDFSRHQIELKSTTAKANLHKGLNTADFSH